jgi:hypothetical protein
VFGKAPQKPHALTHIRNRNVEILALETPMRFAEDEVALQILHECADRSAQIRHAAHAPFEPGNELVDVAGDDGLARGYAGFA